MQTIRSLQHPLIKKIVTLHTAKGRRTEGLFLAEGIRTCTALLQSSLKLEYLFVTSEQKDALAHLCDPKNRIVVTDQVIKKISATATPSGIVGVFRIPPAPNIQHISSGIALAHIADPGNAGTLIRTAAALAYTTVVIIEGIDPWGPKVIQASAGTIGQVAIFELSWDMLKKACAASHIQLAALVVQDGEIVTPGTQENRIFVIGSEAHGIPESWINECDERITLPMPGNTESLNAAVAGSIVLYMSYLNRV